MVDVDRPVDLLGPQPVDQERVRRTAGQVGDVRRPGTAHVGLEEDRCRRLSFVVPRVRLDPDLVLRVRALTEEEPENNLDYECWWIILPFSLLSHMAVFFSQLNLGFEIVTGTQAVTSKGSPGSVVDLLGDKNLNLLKKRFQDESNDTKLSNNFLTNLNLRVRQGCQIELVSI